MKLTDLRIVFMGTPEFAVASLRRLQEAGCNIVAVVTAADKPAGRGKKIRQTAVKEYASDQQLAVLQPENLKAPEFVRHLELLEPHLIVVVAFRMLPELVWRVPKLGTFNLHASLLPDYRGAAPINHVIMNGEDQTGATTFMIDEQIDTGNILLQAELPVGKEESAGELHNRLMNLGADLVLETAEKLALGNLKARPQSDFMVEGKKLNNAPKIQKEDCRVDWTMSGEKIVNLVRGLSPYPGAFTYLAREGVKQPLFKIYRARYASSSHQHSPGTIISDGKNELKVAVDKGFVLIDILQQEGKRKMEAGEFLKGSKLISGQSRFS